MKRALVLFCAWLAAAGGAPFPALAGGFQETVNLTGFVPSPVPGEVITPVVPTKWDTRCLPLTVRVNDTLDPIPNPLGPAFLSVAEAAAVLGEALDLWNAVPTSFAEAHIAGTTGNSGPARFDQINEVSFRTGPGFPPSSPQTVLAVDGGAIAVIRHTRLLADFNFRDGLDLDGDGDRDVAAAIATCQDLDGDGDFEYPAGRYEAGTILDADVTFNVGVSSTGSGPAGFRLTADPAQADADPRSVDLMAAAVQAFGLSHGIAHVLTSQKGPDNGAGSPMFPFLDTSDPAAELAVRGLDVDAVTSISALYPEGSASDGPAALQEGDVALEAAFGFIEGEARYGARDEVVLGGYVFAVDHLSGEVVSTAVAGTSRYSSTPNGVNATFLDAARHGIDGKFRLVVPPGLYSVGIEATDAQPARHFNGNLNTFLGEFLHQNDFDEDFWNGPGESALERRPGERSVVRVEAGQTVGGVDIVTNRTRSIANYGDFDLRGFAGAQPGTYYAVRIPAAQYLAAAADAGADAIVQGAAFLTAVEDASAVPVFEEALLTTGRVLPDGSAALDLRSPLARQRGFVGQDFDFAPWWFDDSVGLAQRIGNGIAQGKIDSLFLVLRLPVAAGAGLQIGVDDDAPFHGLSYSSADGRVFTPAAGHNYMFKLILSEDPH